MRIRAKVFYVLHDFKLGGVEVALRSAVEEMSNNFDFYLIVLGFVDESFIQGLGDGFKKNIFIKVRSTGKLLESKITFKNNEANVEIIDGETGISPGQACVFYSKDEFGDKLLGGGWISKTENKNLST